MYDISERISCSDGTCTGIINERGLCNVCGKPLNGWQEREEQKKVEKDKREEEIQEEKNTEIQKKEEKIDIKNLLQKEIAKVKEEKRIKEQVEGKSQDQESIGMADHFRSPSVGAHWLNRGRSGYPADPDRQGRRGKGRSRH